LESLQNKKQEKVRIVIVDDHPVVCHGLAQIIAHDANLHVCAEAEDAKTGFEAIKKHKPHIAIIDISLKDISGIELIKWVKGLRDFNVLMLVISIHDESVYAERALKAGAQGYLMKQESPDKIIQAIHQILKGEIYVSDSVAKRMMRHLINASNDKVTSIDRLSDRELEVFQLIGQGLKPKQIAEKLFLSVKTIETYQSNLKEKLILNSAFELAQYAVQWMQQKAINR
jgi:DNA-binding NarL/FixJ family response regulator